MSSNSIIFYSFITCPYAIRARLALEELGIAYQYCEIDLLTDQHLKEEYLKINPLHKVPAIVLPDGKILIESTLIVEYFDGVGSKRESRLLSSDPYTLHQQKLAVNFYDAQVTPLKFRLIRFVAQGKQEEALKALGNFQERLAELARLTRLTDRQSKRAQYFWGDTVSYTDICLLPVLHQDCIIIKDIFGKNALLSVNGRNANELQSFASFLSHALNLKSYQRAALKPEQLPDHSASPLLAELAIKNTQQFDFEKVYTYFVRRRFLGLAPANLSKAAL